MKNVKPSENGSSPPRINNNKLFFFQDHIKVDPGLAILPIIAILCGVAIGLGTVALGLILMIRGRHGSSDDHGDVASGDDGS